MGIPAPLGVSASGAPPAGDQANAVVSGQFTGVGVTAPFAFRGPMNIVIYASITDALTVNAGTLSGTFASATSLASGLAINSTLVPPGAIVGSIISGATVALAIPPITLVGMANPGNAQITDLNSTTGLVGATVSGAFLPANDTVVNIITPAYLTNERGKTVKGVIQLSAAPSAYPTQNVPEQIVFQQNGNAITLSGTDTSALLTGSTINYSGSVQLERSFDGGKTWVLANIGGSGVMAIWNAGTPVSLAFGEPERNVLYRLNCTQFSGNPINYRISQTGSAAESIAMPLLS